MKTRVIIIAIAMLIALSNMIQAEEHRQDILLFKINSQTNFTFTNGSSRSVAIGAFIGTVSAASTQILTFSYIDPTKVQTNDYLPVTSTNQTQIFLNYAVFRGIWHAKGAVFQVKTTSPVDIDGSIFLVK